LEVNLSRAITFHKGANVGRQGKDGMKKCGVLDLKLCKLVPVGMCV
jgi:hypothetical protein